MPDIGKWYLSHSPLRLRFEQNCLEILTFAEAKCASPQMERWFSKEQATIIEELVTESWQHRLLKTPDLTSIPSLHGAEALESTLALLVSRLRSTSNIEEPPKELLEYADNIQRLWDIESKAEKPQSRLGMITWRRSLEHVLHWAYIDFLLCHSSDIAADSGLMLNDVMKIILRESIENILTSRITRLVNSSAVLDPPSVILGSAFMGELDSIDLSETVSIDDFASVLFHLFSIAKNGRDLCGTTEADLGWIINKIEKAFFSWLAKYKSEWQETDIDTYMKSDRFRIVLEGLFLNRISGPAPGYRMLFPIDLRFTSEYDELDPSPFGFSLIDDPDESGIQEQLRPEAGTSHLAIAEVTEALSHEDAAHEAISRIENWLAFLTMNVNKNYYHRLVKNVYTSVNMSNSNTFLHSSTPDFPYLSIKREEYEKVMKWFAPLIGDTREVCKKTFRALRFYHNAIHSTEPEVQFRNLWLALESIAGKKGFDKRVWKNTLPILISEYQPKVIWDELRSLSKDEMKALRRELADNVIPKIDYMQRLRSQYFFHPEKTEWNRELLNDVLYEMREITYNAIAVVSTTLATDSSICSFEELALKLQKQWGSTN